MRNKPSVQARCPEDQKLLKQKQVGPIGLAVAPRFVNQHVFHDAHKLRPGLPLSSAARIRLLALLLKQVCKRIRVAIAIGNKRIAVGPLQELEELDLSQLRPRQHFFRPSAVLQHRRL
jgi:hypothetical protein